MLLEMSCAVLFPRGRVGVQERCRDDESSSRERRQRQKAEGANRFAGEGQAGVVRTNRYDLVFLRGGFAFVRSVKAKAKKVLRFGAVCCALLCPRAPTSNDVAAPMPFHPQRYY